MYMNTICGHSNGGRDIVSESPIYPSPQASIISPPIQVNYG